MGVFAIKTVMIFGAGQTGRAISRLLGVQYEFLGFLDNFAEGNGIYRPEQVLKLSPECVILGVLDSDRPLEMWAQLMGLGYKGDIIRPNALNIFDARTAVMRLLAMNAPDGDVAELGVFRGNFALAVSKAFPGRALHLFDTFEGFDERDLALEEEEEHHHEDFTDTSAEGVQKRIPVAVIHKGWFPDTFKGCEDLRFAFVSLDADLYAPTKAGLELFWPRLNRGGSIMVHDYVSAQFPDVKKAVDEFCATECILPAPVADLHGSVILMKN